MRLHFGRNFCCIRGWTRINHVEIHNLHSSPQSLTSELCLYRAVTRPHYRVFPEHHGHRYSSPLLSDSGKVIYLRTEYSPGSQASYLRSLFNHSTPQLYRWIMCLSEHFALSPLPTVVAGFLFWNISFVGPGSQVDIGMYLGDIFQYSVFWTWRSRPEGGGDVRGAFWRSVEELQKEGTVQTSSMVILNHCRLSL